MAKCEVKCVVRSTGKKFQSPWEGLGEAMKELVLSIHDEMYVKATAARDSHLKTVNNWDEFMSALNNRDICLADWCDQKSCEERIKDQSKEESMKAMAEMNEDEALLTGSAKTLCIPYQMGRQASGEAEPFAGVKCFFC
jgi:prolyl-tRNA synthetase